MAMVDICSSTILTSAQQCLIVIGDGKEEKETDEWDGEKAADGWVAGVNEDRTCREGRHNEVEK